LIDAKSIALPLIADLLLPLEIAKQVGTGNGDLLMFRDQMINFLQAAVVFLLLTNVVSALMATCALRLLSHHAGVTRAPTSIERKLKAILDLNT
jgi:hypothetical protein